jgi:CheY-like chemotaxis protein
MIEGRLRHKSIKPRFNATPDNEPENGRDPLRAQKRSKPGFATTTILLSLGVAIVVFALAGFILSSLWWAILVAYAAQVSFILVMLGGYYMRNIATEPQNPYDTERNDGVNDRIIDTEPPVWLSYQPRMEGLNRVRRVAVSAASNRNSRKCCEWLADYDCEVHLCSDHDTLIGDLIARPERWSLLIVDVDHIGGLDAVPRELEYIRSGLAQVPVILMSNRAEKETLDVLIPRKQNMVLAKPFFRKCLFTAVEKLNPVTAQDGH